MQPLEKGHPEVFLGKVVLKICSKFTGEHPCGSAIWHGCSPVIWCMFSDHLFLRTPLDGCFCFNLLLVGFMILLFCCFVFLRVLFHISAIMKLRIASSLYIFCFIFILASHGIIILKIVFFMFLRKLCSRLILPP